MLLKDVAIVNGMVRTKDSVKVRDAVRPGLVQVGKTLFWHGREGDVVSVQGDIIILDIDGEKYKVRAGECESGTTGDSLKTKDSSEYKGYILSKNSAGGITIKGRPGSIYERVVKNFNSEGEAKSYIDKEDREYEKKLNRESSRFEREGNYDSKKTKDGEDQTIGNYNGYHIVFNGGFIRAQEDGFTKIEFPSSMGAGGWSRADVQKMFDKIDWYTTRTVGE